MARATSMLSIIANLLYSSATTYVILLMVFHPITGHGIYTGATIYKTVNTLTTASGVLVCLGTIILVVLDLGPINCYLFIIIVAAGGNGSSYEKYSAQKDYKFL